MQRGADIDGESSGGWSGYSVSLNDAGTVLAIGLPHDAYYVIVFGKARVLEWSNEEDTWISRGDTMIHFIEEEYAKFGWSISLDSSGDTVAVGAPDAGDNQGADCLHLRLEWNGMEWIEMESEREDSWGKW